MKLQRILSAFSCWVSQQIFLPLLENAVDVFLDLGSMTLVYLTFGLAGHFAEAILKTYYLVRGGGIPGLVLDIRGGQTIGSLLHGQHWWAEIFWIEDLLSLNSREVNLPMDKAGPTTRQGE